MAGNGDDELYLARPRRSSSKRCLKRKRWRDVSHQRGANAQQATSPRAPRGALFFFLRLDSRQKKRRRTTPLSEPDLTHKLPSAGLQCGSSSFVPSYLRTFVPLCLRAFMPSCLRTFLFLFYSSLQPPPSTSPRRSGIAAAERHAAASMATRLRRRQERQRGAAGSGAVSAARRRPPPERKRPRQRPHAESASRGAPRTAPRERAAAAEERRPSFTPRQSCWHD